jgi:WD40 repeat protein
MTSSGGTEKGLHIGHVGGNAEVSAGRDIIGGDQHVYVTLGASVAEAVRARPLDPQSPYRGLEFFADQDRELFFGRDGLIQGLLAKLEVSPLVLVLGASGSGKSSLVRAGLLPRYRDRSGGRARQIVLLPNDNPFKALESGLIQAGFSQALAARVLDAQPETVPAVFVSQRAGFDGLLFVDQFEELFTQSDERWRGPFIAALLALRGEPRARLKVVLAMRADFLDRLSPFASFVQALERNIQLVTDMQPDELRLAIEEPAARHGVLFEAGLVDEIIRELQGQPGSLPLLQYTLDLLWAQELAKPAGLDERTLRIETYRNLGGVRGALQKRAEAIYADLGARGENGGAERQALARQIVLRLVDVARTDADAALRPVRRRVPMATFARPDEQTVLRVLIDEKLLVSNRTPGAAEGDAGATVEVAHEALFGCWSRLTDWISDARDSIATKNRLADDAGHWSELRGAAKGGAEDELWAGSRLEQALQRRAAGDFDVLFGGLSPDEGAFLDASIRARDARRNAERRQRRTAFGVLTGFLVVAVAGLLFSNQLRQKAERATEEAQAATLQAEANAREAGEQRNNSVARQYARESELAMGPSAEALVTSTAYAVESLRHARTLDGLQYLADRLQLLPPPAKISWKAHDSGIQALSVALDAHQVATLGDKDVAIWSLEPGREGQLHQRFESNHPPLSPNSHALAFSRDGRFVAAACPPMVCIWNTRDGTRKWVDVGYEDPVLALDFDPRGTALAVGQYHRPALFVSLTSDRAPVNLGDKATALSIAFSRTGNELGIATTDGVRLLKPDGQALPSGLLKGAIAVAFDNAGRRFAIRTTAGVAFGVFQLPGLLVEAPASMTTPSQGSVGSWLGFDPEDNYLLESPNARLWDLDRRGPPRAKGALRKAGREVMRFVDPETRVRFAGSNSMVGVNGDRAFFLSIEADQGEFARLPVGSPGRMANGVDFSGDARRLAVCDDGGVSILEHGDGGWQQVGRAPLDGGGMGVRISPNGRVAASWNDLTLVLTEAGQTHPVTSMAGAPGSVIWDAIFSGSGDLLAVAVFREVTLLRTSPPYDRIQLEPLERKATHLGFSADGRLVVTRIGRQCSRGMPEQRGTTSLYDAKTGERLAWRAVVEDGPRTGCRPPEDGAPPSGGDVGLLDQAERWLVPFKDTRELGRTWAVELPWQPTDGSPGSFTVNLTERASGRSLNLVRHDAPINGIDLSPDERWLATASADGSVRIWPLTSEDLIEQACQRLPPDTPAPTDGPGEHRLLCPPREAR